MNLWVRLLWVVLTAWRKSRTSVFETTRLTLRVNLLDLDANGHVNNGRYLSLADLGRIDFAIRTGAMRVAMARRAYPVVGDVTAKFRRDLRLFERYQLHTRMLGWLGKWTFTEHRFVANGRVVGTVVVRGLFRAKAGPIAPDVFVDALGIMQASPPLPDWVITWNDSCDAQSANLRKMEA